MEPATSMAEANNIRDIDIELSQLNISDQLRSNASFMKIIAALFHYGNQAMDATQLVIAVKTLDLLPLPDDAPKNAIQDIITTSRQIAQDLKISDPFRIEDEIGVQLKYAIADDILNGVKTPENVEIPGRDKRHRTRTVFYQPQSKPRTRKKSKNKKLEKKVQVHVPVLDFDSSDLSEFDGEDEDMEFTPPESPIKEKKPVIKEDDTIATYSLLYYPPTNDMDYIDPINFTEYPVASHFAIVQQKGYSYPRFRSLEKTKIPKPHCEDKFRVTDILKDTTVVGRLFILADGHGGPGCAEYFVRNTPNAVNSICSRIDPQQLDKDKLRSDISTMIHSLDDEYLALKRQQLDSRQDEHIDNDGCTLILNIFLGEWLINVNVGDSRSVLISAPEPSTKAPPKADTIDTDYKMDVVFASQDHKPYLEHLARHILENGGEFIDSSQNRVIKVELDKLGNRNTKRAALKKARIRPKKDDDHSPTLNVARSCGDLDFKMDRKIISCEPDITFIQVSSNQETRRHFLFMSSDGTFDYMFEETPEQQNRAIARVLGPMIEHGEKSGKYLLEEEEKYMDLCIDGVPLLHRELNEQETQVRKVKERTLVSSARYFANREAAHGFFSPTLQNYDDCTIILVEI